MPEVISGSQIKLKSPSDAFFGRNASLATDRNILPGLSDTKSLTIRKAS